MTLPAPQPFIDANNLDFKVPIYIVNFPELDTPFSDVYFTTSYLPFLPVCKVLLSAPRSFSQTIVPEEGRASISAVSLMIVDQDGYFTDFISQDIDSSLHNRKAVLRAGYAGADSLDSFLVAYTGRVKEYDESPPGTYSVEIDDAQKALQRKLFRNAGEDRILLESYVLRDPGYPAGTDPTDDQPYPAKPEEFPTLPNDETTYRGWIRAFEDPPRTPNIPPPNWVKPAPEMQVNQFKGKHLLITTGYTERRRLYIIENTEVKFKLSSDLAPGSTTAAILFTLGVRLGNRFQVVNPPGEEPEPYYFYGNPITLLLMFLTSTGIRDSNGPYDRLSEANGLAIPYEDVDIDRFLEIRDNYFPGDSHNLQFSITERETAKKFIESEIFKTLNLYPILRGDGKISATILKPPLPIREEDPPYLNEDNIIGFPKWSGNLQSMINEIQFSTNHDGEEFLLKQYFVEGNSLLKRGEGKKELKIESKGLKDSSLGGNRLYSTIVQRRVNSVFNRFAVPPVEIKVQTRFDRLLLEAGDSLYFSHRNTPDIKKGIRGQEPLLVEVLQRTIDWDNGKVNFTLLDTGFGKGTYQVISPAMYILDTLGVVTWNTFEVSVEDGDKFASFYRPVIKIYSPNRLEKYDGRTIISMIKTGPPSNRYYRVVFTPTITDAPPPDPSGWFVTFDDYDNATAEQKAWGYISDADSYLGTGDDPAHLIVP